MEIVYLIVGVVVGGIAGYAIALVRRRSTNDPATSGIRIQEEARLLGEQRNALEASLQGERELVTQARERVAALEAEMKALVDRLDEQKKFVDETRTQMTNAFAATGQKALDANSDRFLKLATESYKPIQELLAQQGKAVRELEEKRAKAQGETEQMIKQVLVSSESLRSETGKLVKALRRPEQRGRWGELQLRNVVELAGMVNHCDFTEQVSVESEEGHQRPDMIINLPGGGVIVVDSKVALDHYLDAMEDEAQRGPLLDQHADAVQKHFRSLSNKAYWKQFDPSPELVVMFMPLESALVAALERKPELHADALENRVLIATPTLLVGLLRAIAFGWRQDAINANAQKIAEIGQELHDRIGIFTETFGDVGKRLGQAVASYNKSVGSLETRLLKSASKIKALGATASDEIETPDQIDREVRALSSQPNISQE